MKKNYLAPKVKAVEVRQSSIICTSPGVKTEKLETVDFDWEEE